MFQPAELESFNVFELNRQLDITKSNVFAGKNSAFLASVMGTMPMIWTDQIRTAATNGEYIWWNPKDFLACNQNDRDSTLLHEIWHKVLLHPVRCGERNPDGWNVACDFKVNSILRKLGHLFQTVSVYDDPFYDDMVEEDIYEHFMQENPDFRFPELPGLGSGGDMFGMNANEIQTKDMPPIPPADPAKMSADVQQAILQAEMMDGFFSSDDLTGAIKKNLQQFLSPIIQWDALLYRWLSERLRLRSTYRRPNRRHSKIYMPTRHKDTGGLDHLMWFFDVSGSVSDTEAIRMGSEFRHVKQKYKPKKMTLVQFDEQITKVEVFEDRDKFEKIEIVGRRGTDLRCVRNYIIEHKPTAAVVFSDLLCAPMQPLPPELDVEMIWVAVGNKYAQVPHGQRINIKA